MQYEKALREDGYEKILKYGICFFKKGCMVKIQKKEKQDDIF